MVTRGMAGTAFKKKKKKGEEDDEEDGRLTATGHGDPVIGKLDTKKVYQVFAGMLFIHNHLPLFVRLLFLPT